MAYDIIMVVLVIIHRSKPMGCTILGVNPEHNLQTLADYGVSMVYQFP